MKNTIIRAKDFFLRKLIKTFGLIFGFGSISFITMCAKYGDIADITGAIKGKVTSSSTGESIQNIEITVKEREVVIKTDNTGNYLIDYLQPQLYPIVAKDIDGSENGEFINSIKTISLNQNETINCDFVLNPK